MTNDDFDKTNKMINDIIIYSFLRGGGSLNLNNY